MVQFWLHMLNIFTEPETSGGCVPDTLSFIEASIFTILLLEIH